MRENITPENQQFIEQLQSVRTQLATLIYNKPDPSDSIGVSVERLASSEVEMSRDAENLPQEQYRQQVATLRKEAKQLEAEVSSRSAEFRTISEPVTIEAVQQLIPKNTALVELVLYKPYDAKANKFGKPHYAAYILKSSGEPQWVETSTPLSLNLGEADAIHQVAFGRLSFNLELRDPKDAFMGNTQNIKQAGRKLDEILMKPIREKLGDVNHIIISPDAQLNKIPFAALVDENNQYLIENYQITYLTTGRDLIRLQNEAVQN